MPDYRLGKLKGRFVIVWHEAGKRHRWRLTAKTPADARAEVREFARQRDALRQPQKRVTVGDIWDEYVAEKEREGKSVGRLHDAWKALRGTFADGVPEVSAELVRGYVGARSARVGYGTIHTELGYLRAALRHAGYQVSFKLPSKPRPRSRHLTPEEARRLIDAAKMPHVRLFIRLALHTAARPSSLTDLSWDRVDFERQRIRLDNPSRDRTAKGRATVPMAAELVGPLSEARRAALTNYVIEWNGKPIRSLKKAIQRAAARCGLAGVTPYVLRHSAAVWMAEGGTSMDEIAQYMGHTSPAVTFRTYARYSPEYLRKASDAISTALYGAGEPTDGTETERK